MKNVLIVGENSYIGTQFELYASEQRERPPFASEQRKRFPFASNNFNIKIVSTKNSSPLTGANFIGIDTVLFVAGIAHVAQKKHMRDLYYSVNCDLAVHAAQLAAAANVSQFIYISSMAVYGSKVELISHKTDPNPNKHDFYGCSKLLAEKELATICAASHSLKLCILRPPMVYGAHCKGNFPKLVSLSRKLPIIPHIHNKRSMIHIHNLCEFICQAINQHKGGTFLPQNTEYVNTTNLMKLIAKSYGKKMHHTKLLNPCVALLQKFVPSIKKMFGTLTYEMSGDEHLYNIVDFEDGVLETIDHAL